MHNPLNLWIGIALALPDLYLVRIALVFDPWAWIYVVSLSSLFIAFVWMLFEEWESGEMDE